MNSKRRDFLKKACISGGCLCGFTSLVKAVPSSTEPDPDKLLMQEWISTLVSNINENADEKMRQKIMKSCAISHYEHLNMDSVLEPYVGDLEKFNQFIEEKWGWKIDYQKEKGILLADENKNYCVCPMVNQEKGVKSTIYCYCSEGFAEQMFSVVVGHQVKAKVISSVLRGDERCIYEITLS